MKRHYTAFGSHVSRALKDTRISMTQFQDMLDASIKNKEIDDGEAAAYGMEMQVLEGECFHIYMPDKLFCDWLVSCTGELEPNHLRVLRDALGMDEKKVAVLNFPCESSLFSVVFYVWQRDEGCTLEVSFSSHKKTPVGWFVRDVPAPPGAIPQHSECTEWYSRLIVGLGMYWNCFPECVKEGFPDDLKHPSHHNNKFPLSVSVSPHVVSESSGRHSSPTGHFRSGHFRILRSPRFTKKRFQCVFVRETFVNGHAKTVLSPEQIVEAK